LVRPKTGPHGRDIGGSIGGGVVSYEVAGKQYAATTTGWISNFFGGRGAGTIVVFTLP
jgi:alcohol dehydrogenase (cytochrome c)